MDATVSEWVAKAEGDYRTAERELHPTGTPNFDAVCFHAEQCAEKLIKALLIHLGASRLPAATTRWRSTACLPRSCLVMAGRGASPADTRGGGLPLSGRFRRPARGYRGV